MDISVRQLVAFLTVANLRSFTATAKVMHLTQSGVRRPHQGARGALGRQAVRPHVAFGPAVARRRGLPPLRAARRRTCPGGGALHGGPARPPGRAGSGRRRAAHCLHAAAADDVRLRAGPSDRPGPTGRRADERTANDGREERRRPRTWTRAGLRCGCFRRAAVHDGRLGDLSSGPPFREPRRDLATRCGTNPSSSSGRR